MCYKASYNTYVVQLSGYSQSLNCNNIYYLYITVKHRPKISSKNFWGSLRIMAEKKREEAQAKVWDSFFLSDDSQTNLYNQSFLMREER